MKKNVTKIIKMLLSLGLVALLFWKLDWELVGKELETLHGGYILLFLLFQGIAMVISVKKWQSIARYQNSSFTLWEGLKAYLTGTFVNNFLPSTIGGDIYRSIWLARRGESKTKAFSSVIFDRVTGLFVTLVLALIMGFFVWQIVSPFPHFLTVSYLGIFLLIPVFLATAFLVPGALVSMIPWKKLRTLFEETARYRNRGVWTEATFWSALFIFFGLGISNYILFLALGYTLPFLPFFGLVLLMALYVSLPISINNIGVKEWAYGVLFILLGVSFDTAVTVALLSRVLQTGISLLALPAYLLEKKTFPAAIEMNQAPHSETP